MYNQLVSEYFSSKQQGQFVHRKDLHYILVFTLSTSVLITMSIVTMECSNNYIIVIMAVITLY